MSLERCLRSSYLLILLQGSTYALNLAILTLIFYSRGYTDFINVRGWNPMGWGNIGVTLGLFFVRVLYLVGAFGQDKVINSTKAIKKNI